MPHVVFPAVAGSSKVALAAAAGPRKGAKARRDGQGRMKGISRENVKKTGNAKASTSCLILSRPQQTAKLQHLYPHLCHCRLMSKRRRYSIGENNSISLTAGLEATVGMEVGQVMPSGKHSLG